MQGLTKKHPTEKGLVPLQFMVHPLNVERIKQFVAAIEPEEGDEGAITAGEFFEKYYAGESKASVVLRGYRHREAITQAQLAEMTGIPQRHISEVEHDKRSIGKDAARKLAKALNCDYRRFL